ncbi:MAG: hypothetical protein H0V97_09625 [Actinobacteria bacterium]|nr:hypothetical protein [Actinomycetota bacterium]
MLTHLASTDRSNDDDDLAYTERRVLNVLGPEGSGLSYSQIGDKAASDGKGKPLKRTTIQAALDVLSDQKLADGITGSGREPSLYWRTESTIQGSLK